MEMQNVSHEFSAMFISLRNDFSHFTLQSQSYQAIKWLRLRGKMAEIKS